MKLLHLAASLALLTLAASAQDAERITDADLLASRPSVPYWDAIFRGGPIYLALHLFVAVAFLWAVVAAIRRAPTVRTVILCTLPFVFGATAMWIGTLGLIAIANANGTDIDPYPIINGLPRPFYFGAALSFAAFIVFGASHALNRNA